LEVVTRRPPLFSEIPIRGMIGGIHVTQCNYVTQL